MLHKRTTIYDVARALGVSASYVSRALNDHPSYNQKVRDRVKKKAAELNYRHNLRAANLRRGSSKIIGVIVPKIDESTFSKAIAGIEEVCVQNDHTLIIYQSHDSFVGEQKAIDLLIQQNVSCIMIAVASDTQTFTHLDEIRKNNVELIQFDRCFEKFSGYKVKNDNRETAYRIVKLLVKQGYQKIAFLGGPITLPKFKSRKDGYLQAVKEMDLLVPYNYIIDDVLIREKTIETVRELLALKQPPDAILTVSDHQSLAVLEVAKSIGVSVPGQLGIFGFDNEPFTAFVDPPLSTVSLKNKELGKAAAELYFKNILLGNSNSGIDYDEIVPGEIIVRKSSLRMAAAEL